MYIYRWPSPLSSVDTSIAEYFDNLNNNDHMTELLLYVKERDKKRDDRNRKQEREREKNDKEGERGLHEKEGGKKRNVEEGEKIEEKKREIKEKSKEWKEIPIISFSHFLPLQELLPQKQFLNFKKLPKVKKMCFIQKNFKFYI